MNIKKLQKYEVILNGVNYLLLVDDEIKKMGFYVTRYIEAGDLDEAENRAIEMIQKSSFLNAAIKNEQDNPPLIYIDEVYEIDSFEDLESLEPGFGFYEL